jgi:hypothetical protein
LAKFIQLAAQTWQDGAETAARDFFDGTLFANLEVGAGEVKV